MAGDAIKPKTDRDYEIDSAADTLMRAAELKADGALYKAAIKRLEQRQKALGKVLAAT